MTPGSTVLVERDDEARQQGRGRRAAEEELKITILAARREARRRSSRCRSADPTRATSPGRRGRPRRRGRAARAAHRELAAAGLRRRRPARPRRRRVTEARRAARSSPKVAPRGRRPGPGCWGRPSAMLDEIGAKIPPPSGSEARCTIVSAPVAGRLKKRPATRQPTRTGKGVLRPSLVRITPGPSRRPASPSRSSWTTTESFRRRSSRR